MVREFLTIAETANTLGVSTRHARRLADSQEVTRIARGLIDPNSVDRYLHSHRQGRTRAWAEHTAWGAIAMLAGFDAPWLGTTQASRLRSALREIDGVDELLTRMRNRAHVHTFDAHRAALRRLRSLTAATNLRLLGISDPVDDRVDGYLAEADLDTAIRTFGLRASANGPVVLRTTGFDIITVRRLVGTSTVAALDAAISTDPRHRSIAHRTLEEIVGTY